MESDEDEDVIFEVLKKSVLISIIGRLVGIGKELHNAITCFNLNFEE